MIQILTDNFELEEIYKDKQKYIINSIYTPESFDEFDINIIDLNYKELWENNDNYNNIECFDELKHYRNIIMNSTKTKILVILPQNLYVNIGICRETTLNHGENYLNSAIELIETTLKDYIYPYYFNISYEPTITKINNKDIKADFYFNNTDNEDINLKSFKSQKAISINIDKRIFLTTLDVLGDKEILNEYLLFSKILEDEKLTVPEWINEINILDDKILKDNISKIEKNIQEKLKEKEEKNKKLEENNKIKSILYETDKNLQNEVIEILNDIFDYKDKNFIDEMEEDYRIKMENITFIIETKGLSRNIKGEDISKTLNHVEVYKDKLEENNVIENIKGIYIVATQRNKKIEDRENTPDRQVTLAKRNGILIIRTEELLKLYQAFKNGQKTKEQIIKIFKEQKGEYKFKEK